MKMSHMDVFRIFDLNKLMVSTMDVFGVYFLLQSIAMNICPETKYTS